MIIKNRNEKYYVCSKINDEILFCGDPKEMNEARHIISIYLVDIFSRKYYMLIKSKIQINSHKTE